jgi:hypothetical protein
MMPFKKKKDDEFFFDTNDIVVIFDDENKTSDIQRVSEIREGTIYVTGKYAIPYDDCQITTGTEGRNFFYRAPAQSVIETQRLAALEQSMVLNQITNYKPPVPPAAMDWTKGMLFGLVFLAFIIMGVTSCSR